MEKWKSYESAAKEKLYYVKLITILANHPQSISSMNG